MYDDERNRLREQAAEGRHHAEAEAASQRARERVQRGVALLDACPEAHGWRARVYRNLNDLDVAIPHQCVLAYALGGPDGAADSWEEAIILLFPAPRDDMSPAHAGFDSYEANRTAHDARAYYQEQGEDHESWSLAWSHAMRDEYALLTALWAAEIFASVHRPTRKDLRR